MPPKKRKTDDNTRLVRWGFLSTANICNKNFNAIKSTKLGEVVAVGSRSLSTAGAFASKHGIKRAYESYEKVLSDPDVDAVYIPLPTGIRCNFVILAAKAKKHILCDKPTACNSEEMRQILTAVKEAGVHFMDGVMYMHNPRLMAMHREIHSPSFGAVRYAQANFCFGLVPAAASNPTLLKNIRINRDTEPLGALGDLGWYCIRLLLFAFDYEPPQAVSANIEWIDVSKFSPCDPVNTSSMSEAEAEKAKKAEIEGNLKKILACCNRSGEGVPLTVTAQLRFSNARTAQFSCSLDQSFRQTVEIVGANHSISYNDLCIPNVPNKSSFYVSYCPGLINDDTAVAVDGKTVQINTPLPQEALMFKNFQTYIINKYLDPKPEGAKDNDKDSNEETAATEAELPSPTGQRKSSRRRKPTKVDGASDKEEEIDDNESFFSEDGSPNQISWGNMALLTQSVCDAVLASSAKQGQFVDLVYSPI